MSSQKPPLYSLVTSIDITYFGFLKPSFVGHADLHRKAVGARQNLVGELERHLRLRMQRARHIERRVVAVLVGALEPDIFGAHIGADQLQEVAQRRAGPAADRAPALDADMAGDLLDLRQGVEFVQRPRLLVLDEAAHFQLPALAVDRGRFVKIVIGVERKRFCDRALGKGRRQRVRIEHPGLHGVVEFRDLLEHLLGGRAVDDVAAREQRQRAEARASGDEAAARKVGHRFGGVANQQRRVDAGNDQRAFAGHDENPPRLSGR